MTSPAVVVAILVGLLLLARQGNTGPARPPVPTPPIAQTMPSAEPIEPSAPQASSPAPPPAPPSCTLAADKANYCVGEMLQATLTGPPTTAFDIQAQYWGLWVTALAVTTDADGRYAATLPLEISNTYAVRATSTACTTPALTVTVADCGGG